MSELYPVLVPFAACFLFFIVWLVQEKKSVRKLSTASAVSPAPRHEAVVSERTVESTGLQTSAV